ILGAEHLLDPSVRLSHLLAGGGFENRRNSQHDQTPVGMDNGAAEQKEPGLHGGRVLLRLRNVPPKTVVRRLSSASIRPASSYTDRACRSAGRRGRGALRQRSGQR